MLALNSDFLSKSYLEVPTTRKICLLKMSMIWLYHKPIHKYNNTIILGIN